MAQSLSPSWFTYVNHKTPSSSSSTAASTYLQHLHLSGNITTRWRVNSISLAILINLRTFFSESKYPTNVVSIVLPPLTTPADAVAFASSPSATLVVICRRRRCYFCQPHLLIPQNRSLMASQRHVCASNPNGILVSWGYSLHPIDLHPQFSSIPKIPLTLIGFLISGVTSCTTLIRVCTYRFPKFQNYPYFCF